MEPQNLGKNLHKANSSLAVIYGYLQLLEKSLEDKENKKEGEWVKKALDGCKKLQSLINDMEEYATN